MALSHFNLSDCLYGSCVTENYKRKIQITQNPCLRLIYGIRRQERFPHKLREANWLNIEARRFLHTATLLHKIIIFRSPAYLFEKLTFRTDVYNINMSIQRVADSSDIPYGTSQTVI
nr:unnamed protein product [Callosobruchus analis]